MQSSCISGASVKKTAIQHRYTTSFDRTTKRPLRPYPYISVTKIKQNLFDCYRQSCSQMEITSWAELNHYVSRHSRLATVKWHGGHIQETRVVGLELCEPCRACGKLHFWCEGDWELEQVPRRLWSLHPWSCSKVMALSTHLQVALLEQEVGPAELQGSLPTSTLLWMASKDSHQQAEMAPQVNMPSLLWLKKELVRQIRWVQWKRKQGSQQGKTKKNGMTQKTHMGKEACPKREEWSSCEQSIPLSIFSWV